MCADKEVDGIHAAWNVAVVQDQKSIWYRSDIELITQAVGCVELAVNLNLTIALGLD